jgi:uncharacterized membrane protein YdbT with pleckstrin-like domain
VGWAADQQWRSAVGSYVENNLSKDETVKYSARVSLWKHWFSFLIAVFFTLAALVGFASSLSSKGGTGSWMGSKLSAVLLLIALAVFVWPLIARTTTELVITNKRLIAKFGFISTQSIEIRFDRIESVRVNQSVMGRILNYGDIVVTGTGSTFDPIPNIAGPMKFRAALNHQMETTPASGAAGSASIGDDDIIRAATRT